MLEMRIHQEWNKKHTLQYSININDVNVVVNTHEKGLLFPPFIAGENVNHNVTIWYDSTISNDLAKQITSIVYENKAMLPASICDAYSYLGLGLENMQKHINKYVDHCGDIYVHYAFPSDDFYMIYNKTTAEIYLWGNRANLERILVSILSMTGDALPFHAACVSVKDKGYLILGDTNSGKTSLVLELMRRGASYVSDDIIYVDSSFYGHRCCDYLSMRAKYLHPSLENSVEFSRGEKVFMPTKELCRNLKCSIESGTSIDEIIILNPLLDSNISCTKLFCAFRHDSMVMNEILGGNICDMIDASMKLWNNMCETIPVNAIELDHNNFVQSLGNIAKVFLLNRL